MAPRQVSDSNVAATSGAASCPLPRKAEGARAQVPSVVSAEAVPQTVVDGCQAHTYLHTTNITDGAMNNNIPETWRTYATVCRLCLQKDGFMLGIFNHLQGKDKSIYKKIIDCTALQISHGDGLPNVICHRCLYKIEFCLEFRQLCFMSDATLRQLNGVLSKENGSDSGTTPHLPFYEQLVGGNDADVVMVVDPNAGDYESDYESEKEAPQSDVEANDNGETNDIEPEGRGVAMCKFCDHAFTDAADCHAHELSAHDRDQPYHCNSCIMGFADRILYSAHLKSVHKNDKPYNCPQCDRTFARRSDLRKHTIVHTGVKPFTCPSCLKSFSRNTNLSKHMRIHQGAKPFVCPKCPKSFTSKAEMAKHQNVHSAQRPFPCMYCRMSFGRKDKLARHERRHFPQRSEQGENGTEEEERRRELAKMRETLAIYSTMDIRPDNEDAGIKNEGSENMVISLDPFNHNNYSATPHHGDVSETEPQIDHDIALPDRVKLEDLQEDPKLLSHLEESLNVDRGGDKGKEISTSKTSEKAFKCPECPKRFSKKDNLRTHQLTHSGVRPFQCNVCNKSFCRKRELDRHSTTHSGARPFKCPKCFKSFGRKDKMLRHARIHDSGITSKESFACDLCSETFSSYDALQQHATSHIKHEDYNVDVNGKHLVEET